MIVLPTPVIARSVPSRVATEELLLMKLQSPGDVEVGGVSVMGALPKGFVIITKDPSFGMAGVTMKMAVVLAVKEDPDGANIAERVVLPAPTIVKVLPLTDATL
jgi:hypothetical protein